ncbi:hypothetical protein F5Y19DRAFT_466467 [Xylariaceae sp. FL1651]|nr:hypothetical protein F5Y19DRAFT_466467 [Xylariaceae sp. FL1651]
MATRLPGALPRRPSAALAMSSPLSAYTSSPAPPTTTHYQTPTHARTPLSFTPSRAATLIRRPRRPYTFTQLVQLSDGSTYTMRTSSPLALYKSSKDARNHALWNPSDRSLRNVEVDEAGRLATFRERFGRGWDAERPVGEEAQEAAAAAAGEAAKKGGKKVASGRRAASASAPAAAADDDVGSGDALADLIAGYAVGQPELPASAPPRKKKPTN